VEIPAAWHLANTSLFWIKQVVILSTLMFWHLANTSLFWIKQVTSSHLSCSGI
jgi:hypothetical protein